MVRCVLYGVGRLDSEPPFPRRTRRSSRGAEMTLDAPLTRISRPKLGVSVSVMVMVPIAADRVRDEHASCRGDGDGADEQKDGCEAHQRVKLHACHLLSHYLDLIKMGHSVQMIGPSHFHAALVV